MRARYKNKIRKSTKYFGIFISIVLLIISLASFITNISNENMKTRTKEIYKYTNKFNYDYKVNLIDNKYISEDGTDKTIAYVTDLIDTTDLTLNYTYTADKTSNLEYKYSIIGKLQAVYTKDGDEQKIIDTEETLLEEKNNLVTSDKIEINEVLNLDLKEKNNLLEEFKQEMGMSIEAKYSVILKVEVHTNIEDKQVDVNYQTPIELDLAEKTTKIAGENNKENTSYISKEYNVDGENNIPIIIVDIIIIIICIAVLRYLMKTRTVNIVKNEFRLELNRILKICQDKIVKVSNKPHDDPKNIVFVKDFGEIVKVSEELFKPILYYFDNQNQEAWFSVMTGNTTYRYILKS